jgi:hypothetical protein
MLAIKQSRRRRRSIQSQMETQSIQFPPSIFAVTSLCWVWCSGPFYADNLPRYHVYPAVFLGEKAGAEIGPELEWPDNRNRCSVMKIDHTMPKTSGTDMCRNLSQYKIVCVYCNALLYRTRKRATYQIRLRGG